MQDIKNHLSILLLRISIWWVVPLVVTLWMLPPNRAEAQDTHKDVKTFVHVEYEHGVPYEQATHFDKNAVPILLEMLKDTTERKWWSNIVFTLGVIGDDRAVHPLIQFLEKDVKGEAGATLGALLGVPRALGEIAAHGSEKALEYLMARMNPEGWQNKSLPWYYGEISGTKLYLPLMKLVIIGLGVSAQPKALRVLVKAKANPAYPEYLKPAVTEALKLAEEIKSRGRIQVFGNRDKQKSK